MTLALKQRLKFYGITITGLLVLSVYLYIVETIWDEKRPDLYEEQVDLTPPSISPDSFMSIDFSKQIKESKVIQERLAHEDPSYTKEELDDLERIQTVKYFQDAILRIKEEHVIDLLMLNQACDLSQNKEMQALMKSVLSPCQYRAFELNQNKEMQALEKKWKDYEERKVNSRYQDELRSRSESATD